MDSYRRFQQGDMVTYTGSKFAKELHGALGIVHGFVDKTDHGVVVDFGKDSYIVNEVRCLTAFQGKRKTEDDEKEESKGGPDVSKRRPGAKRRVVDQGESE